MESEGHEYATLQTVPALNSSETVIATISIGTDKPANTATDCEEIMLPTDAVTNGITNLGVVSSRIYLEEDDPMADITHNNITTEDAEELDKQDDIEEEEHIDEDQDEEEFEAEEEEEELDAEETVSVNTQKERIPTQVPKKRKDAAMFVLVEEEDDEDDTIINKREEILPENDDEEEDDEENGKDQQSFDELPTSSARSNNKDDSVDENQCRVCMSKSNLVSLFKKVDEFTVAEMLMNICPTVSIASKDFMPQYICNACCENTVIAMLLKSQCESTERELRKKLSRHKNKVRRPTGYVVIDAPVEDEEEEDDEEQADDTEFKVSDVEISASADDSYSDDSDFGSVRRKRTGRGGHSKRGRRKSAVTPTLKQGEKKRIGRPPLKRSNADSSDEGEFGIKKKREYNSGGEKPTEYPCDECEQVFNRKLSLVLHKKVHSTGPPICCKLCGKQFKMQGAYRTHLERHKSETNNFGCPKCDLFFTSKIEMRRHLIDEHNESRDSLIQCNKCRRNFVSQARLDRHLEGYCPGNDFLGKPKRNDYESYTSGKDLFKSVAPLTTTYWSDSFSD